MRGSLSLDVCVLGQVGVCMFVHIQAQGDQARVYVFMYTLYQTRRTRTWKCVLVSMRACGALDPPEECVCWRQGRVGGIHTLTHTLSGGQNVRAIDFLSLRNSL